MIVVLVTAEAVETAPLCTAAMPPGAGVVTWTGEDCVEWLLPLKASTV